MGKIETISYPTYCKYFIIELFDMQCPCNCRISSSQREENITWILENQIKASLAQFVNFQQQRQNKLIKQS